VNRNSLICKYIHSNPITWKKDFENINIRIKEQDNLCLFKYGLEADFNNPLVRESRGIIIDLNTLEVVCIGFNKFFNAHESYADSINWESIRVENKLDGSIVKLFYHNEQWNWSTNGTIFAKDAPCEDLIHTTYIDLIKSAVNYKDIDYNVLDTSNTYIFEIVDPIMHPVKYDEVKLYHIGTRSNITLEESITYIGIEQPERYGLNSLDEIISFVDHMNENKVTQEGVVIVDNNWHRVKIKNMNYLQIHYLKDAVLSKSRVIELLHNDDINLEELTKDYPQYEQIFNFYRNKEIELYYDLQTYLNFVNQTYINFKRDRKRIAEVIKDDKYKFFAFESITRGDNALQLLKKYRLKNIKNYCKLLPDYKNS